MRMLGKVATVLVLLTMSALAQSRGSGAPPASIFSMGGATPPPASIFSLPGNVGNFRGQAVFGFGSPAPRFHHVPPTVFGGGFGVTFPGQRRSHNRSFRDRRFRGGQFQGGAAYYVPYAVPYDGYYEDGYDSVLSRSEIENGGTFESSRRGTVRDEDFREAPTVFENRPQSSRYREGDARAGERDERYGTHYLDNREQRDRDREQQPGETAAAPTSVEDRSPTLLIFRDGHEQEIMNYAIMGSTLFVLSGERTKIPVAEIDVAKTVTANERRGLEFHIPKT